ncbi:MAG: ferrous iron transport protein A [Cellulomonadaceae bacterium]|nr:ferrous iron transport protein A [Cellulomonadaceae bacterium]
MELQLCPAGTEATVEWVNLEPDERQRLRELGIAEGATVHVIHCGMFGSRVIAVGSDRFAIDGKTCACIQVSTDDSHATSPANVREFATA